LPVSIFESSAGDQPELLPEPESLDLLPYGVLRKAVLEGLGEHVSAPV
jgi:hypothetical protein